jgi:hypothetical protein
MSYEEHIVGEIMQKQEPQKEHPEILRPQGHQGKLDEQKSSKLFHCALADHSYPFFFSTSTRNNGKEAETWSVNLLHPYPGNVSVIGDCLSCRS